MYTAPYRLKYVHYVIITYVYYIVYGPVSVSYYYVVNNSSKAHTFHNKQFHD